MCLGQARRRPCRGPHTPTRCHKHNPAPGKPHRTEWHEQDLPGTHQKGEFLKVYLQVFCLFVCLCICYLEGLRNMENFFKFKRNWNPKPHTSSEVIYASKELLAHMKSFNPSFEAFHIQNRMGTERKGQIGMTCRAWKKEEVVTPSSHAHIILLSWLPSASNEAKQILKSNLFVNILLKSMGDFAEIAHGSRPH